MILISRNKFQWRSLSEPMAQICPELSGGNGAVAWHPRRRATSSGVHPQHFLYFLPLPHGQSSFLPVFGVARRV
jgi:hypothetical protein